MDIFHSVWFCARSRSILRDVLLLSTDWNHVCRNLPFLCCPSTTIQYLCISSPRYHHCISLHGQTTSILMPLLMQFILLSSPKHSLSSKEGFLSLKVTLHIHLIILHNKSASFTAQVALPYSMTLLTHVWYTLPFKWREKTPTSQDM